MGLAEAYKGYVDNGGRIAIRGYNFQTYVGVFLMLYLLIAFEVLLYFCFHLLLLFGISHLLSLFPISIILKMKSWNFQKKLPNLR